VSERNATQRRRKTLGPDKDIWAGIEDELNSLTPDEPAGRPTVVDFVLRFSAQIWRRRDDGVSWDKLAKVATRVVGREVTGVTLSTTMSRHAGRNKPLSGSSPKRPTKLADSSQKAPQAVDRRPDSPPPPGASAPNRAPDSVPAAQSPPSIAHSPPRHLDEHTDQTGRPGGPTRTRRPD
jgi:hypothetical protein